tara:strand:- start:16965 stop:18164 length:1200 start_codon:yes stop_codon:yes gene_type:complete
MADQSSPRPIKAERIAGFGTTVFSVWTRLAQQHNAINLGQGFPNFDPPAFVMEAARQTLEGYQQYAPLGGMPRLRQVLAQQAKKDWGRDVNANTEITVTIGATEGIYATIQALINPGDEVILIEPFYDSYPASITMAGGVPRYVPLRPTEDKGWSLDLDELRALITPKTRMLVLNTPHNPTGKCFTRQELQALADICIEHDLLVLSDEVYDKLVFEGATHIPIATLDGMWERTVTLSSAGKTFSVTGWKIGWAIASPALTDAIQMAHQWIPFCGITPLQLAVAEAIEASQTNGYYDELRQLYQGKRDQLVAILREVGLDPYVPEGTYFVIGNTEKLDFDNDEAACQYLTEHVGVAAIPPSHFYSDEHKHLAKHFLRFAFCKDDETIKQSAERLRAKLTT